ncbi:hypothetical protein VdG1_05983 [Verticillium dahliae VDG1]|nr:hypothetical protein VdG1_05983 [Verticillium dahliae VDG1]
MSTALRCPAAPQAASPLSDLHNTSHIPSTVPLVVHLPPFAPIPGADPHLPDFLAPFPTAVINYRWTGPSSLTSSHTAPSTQDEFKAPLYWPTPLHDVLFAYSWLLENLRPENQARRAIYLYGTYLGATLAAALALTESHKHEPTAVRGFAAYNGVYNWTMRKAKGNQFEAQAEELAGLMRRSMEKLELKERMKWDEDFDAEGEMEARVKVVDVGEGSPHELGARGDAAVREWLEQRITL